MKLGGKWEGTQVSFNTTTVVESSGFTLGDDDQGDWFEVDMRIDPRYGTYAFKTITGETRCPPEPGTIAREKPIIKARTPSYNGKPQHPDKSVLLHYQIFNSALGNGALAYEVYTKLDSLGQDGAVLKIDGATLHTPRVFEGMESMVPIDFVLEVQRGPEDFVYDDIKLGVRSMCQGYGAGTYKRMLYFLFFLALLVVASTYPYVLLNILLLFFFFFLNSQLLNILNSLFFLCRH
jgi:hypothetical protein